MFARFEDRGVVRSCPRECRRDIAQRSGLLEGYANEIVLANRDDLDGIDIFEVVAECWRNAVAPKPSTFEMR